MQNIIQGQREEFENRFKLEFEGCSECGGANLIDNIQIKYPKGKYHCEYNLDKIFDWHTSSIKQIIQALIEKEENALKEENLETHVCLEAPYLITDDSGKKICIHKLPIIEYNQAKQDTITHLKQLLDNLQ